MSEAQLADEIFVIADLARQARASQCHVHGDGEHR